jgi:hypothetical protein
MTESNNPLKKFFRQPAIYVKLPSEGQYYPDGSLQMPANGELPIFPMTALDEIGNRTPDALFNGTATVNIIKSCAPSIVDPWLMPQDDVNLLLTAIKIASYGHEMELMSTCPECNEEKEISIDLRTIIDKFPATDYSKNLTIGDMTVYFKPLNYQQVNHNSMQQFEQQKTVQLTSEENTEISLEEKSTLLSDVFKTLTDLTLETIALSILHIQTDSATVNDTKQIKEFLENCESSMFDRIREFLTELKLGTELEKLKLTCDNKECKHNYEQAFTLDMSSFFA